MNLSTARRRPVIVAAMAAALAAWPAVAQDNIPLEIVGPDGGTTAMTRAEIEALPQTEFVTSTIWTDGRNSYSGVPLAEILAHAGATGETLVMSALNDYSVEMPMADLDPETPIVATRVNGAPMSVRDKGPFWVIYPFDDQPEHQTETAHARSVWQLVRLTVKE